MPRAVAIRKELIHDSVFMAPGARISGDVTIGPRSSVWFNAVLRGDTDPIRIGSETNVQDCAVVHADPGFPCTVGDGVTIGHGAIVHGCTIGDNVTIGMGAVVLNGANIGRDSIVAAGAVVTQGAVIAPGSLVMGVPGRVARPVKSEEIQRNRASALHYVQNSQRYAEGSG